MTICEHTIKLIFANTLTISGFPRQACKNLYKTGHAATGMCNQFCAKLDFPRLASENYFSICCIHSIVYKNDMCNKIHCLCNTFNVVLILIISKL